jgi:hypothetical protein
MVCGALNVGILCIAYASGSAGKQFSEEEGNYLLIPSSTNVAVHFAGSCMNVVVRVFRVTSMRPTWLRAGWNSCP